VCWPVTGPTAWGWGNTSACTLGLGRSRRNSASSLPVYKQLAQGLSIPLSSRSPHTLPLSLGLLYQPIRRAWSREEGVAQHTHAPSLSVTTMGATQHYTSSPGAVHWASMKAGLSAGAWGRHAHPREKGKERKRSFNFLASSRGRPKHIRSCLTPSHMSFCDRRRVQWEGRGVEDE